MESTQWDAVIVNYNGGLFLDPCLRALSGQTYGPDHIVVVDNASTDDSLTELAGRPEADVIQSPTNLGYAGGANLGVRSCEAPIVVLLNPDVELDSSYGRALIDVFAANPSLGAAGALLRYPDGNEIQHAGGEINWPELTTRHRGEGQAVGQAHLESADVEYLTGAALAIRREAFAQIGGFDESFYPAYWEDVDLCRRLRDQGWAVRYDPSLKGIHHEGAGLERGDDYYLAWSRNRLRFAMKHLTHQEWWRQFVPAEIERLRGELSAADREAWPVRSGAAAIELLARSGSLDDAGYSTGMRGDRLLDSIDAIRELPAMADPSPRPIGPSDGVLRRLKRFLSRFSGRLYAEELYWQQRQFNEQVVRAFEAQDRLNREAIAQILLSMLLIGEGRVRDREGQPDWNHLLTGRPPYDGF